MASLLSSKGIADLVAKQKEKMEDRKRSLFGSTVVPATTTTATPATPTPAAPVPPPLQVRSLFEVKSNILTGTNPQSNDTYRQAIMILYLSTMRLKRSATHADEILDKWREAHPCLRPPRLYSTAPQHYLIPDLLREVVSWLPTVRYVENGAQVCEEDATRRRHDLNIPYRYRVQQKFSSLSSAIESSRPGDCIAIKGSYFVPTTLKVTRPVTIYGILDTATDRLGTISSGSSSAYTMLHITSGSVVLRNLILTSGGVAVHVSDTAEVCIENTEITGSILQSGGSLFMDRDNLRNSKGRGEAPYGVHVADCVTTSINLCNISGFSTGVKIVQGTCSISRSRVKGTTSGGIVVQKRASAVLEGLDITNLQISGTASVVLNDSKIGPSHGSCLKLLHSGDSPHVGTLQISRNELRSEEEGNCLAIPVLGNPFNANVTENVFVSKGCAVSLRNSKSLTQLQLRENSFSQPEHLAVMLLDCDPSTVRSDLNCFCYRDGKASPHLPPS
eukprot:TRINITY_DN13046_c1_g1_i1.p1 TRINITY_DN13046_c1_g1~~TRINITY_DN13046_c1_g1_i1.p1  ORF type:complete len:510 (+),score=39.34 TRINITY_DN13046_c1_g1_i1:23-1531(+)